MLTIFSTPKPFRGHIDVIQRNALASWKRLHADVEIILFGDDDGAAEVCREMGLVHVPRVERNANGTKFLRSIWEPAQAMARHDLLCYSNCDILLTQEFTRALERVAAWRKDFLMVGRRWDVDITAPFDFSRAEWERDVLALAAQANHQRSTDWIDYFVFSRGLYKNIPPLVIGRVAWDRWLVREARRRGSAIVDASRVLRAVHQNHDYGYHPAGAVGVWNDEAAQTNRRIAGRERDLFTIDDATHLLTASRICWNPKHLWMPSRRAAVPHLQRAWYALLSVTRPVRHALGLRQEAFAHLRRHPK